MENQLSAYHSLSQWYIVAEDGVEQHLPITSLNPKENEWVNNKTIYPWRQFLKRALLTQRGWKSDYSNKPLKVTCHMHEGIVSRAVIPKSIWWHYYIYAPPNCFLLLPEEHLPQPPSRDWCIERAYALYGRDVVREWFYTLPFKVIPFQLP